MEQRSDGRFKHGLVPRHNKPSEFYVWTGMRARCSNAKSKSYPDYGGRGIRVCSEWQNDFAQFLADMGRRPTPGHSIERLDNDGDYCPQNCVWATRVEQAKNRRPRAIMTSCRNGHPLDEQNTYARPDGKRGCKTCRKANMAAYYERKRENG